MNTRISFLLSILSFTSGISSDLNLPCKITDIKCLENFALNVRARVIAGVPELDTKPIDPLFLEEIVGDLPHLQYKFFNTTLTGYKNCVLSNLIVFKKFTSVQYNLDCPMFVVTGKYEMKGELLSLPVQGSGNFEIITGKYFIQVDYKLIKYQGKDGETYMAGKNIELKCVPKEDIKFNFQNIFSGQNDQTDALLKFAHDNSREVAELIQDPIWYACIKTYIKQLNKLMATIPVKMFVTYN